MTIITIILILQFPFICIVISLIHALATQSTDLPVPLGSGECQPHQEVESAPGFCPKLRLCSVSKLPFSWVAVKELKLSYYIGETLLFTIYTHYGNLIKFLNSNPVSAVVQFSLWEAGR